MKFSKFDLQVHTGLQVLWKSKWGGQLPKLFTVDLSLNTLSFSLCLQISCILIPAPEAVFSRQPIKALLSVGASTSCILGVFLSFHLPYPPLHPSQTQTHWHVNTFSLCFIFFCVHLPSAPQLSISVGLSFNTLFLVHSFKLCSSPFLFHFSDLALPDSLWV